MGSFIGIRRTKRRPNPQRRFCKSSSSQNKSRRISSTASASSSAVSDKLEVLNNLIPVHIEGGGGGGGYGRREIKSDQLFQEIADYIVLLRTQISVLQGLLDFYSSNAAAGQQQQPQQNH